jgi:hypothetical protein
MERECGDIIKEYEELISNVASLEFLGWLLKVCNYHTTTFHRVTESLNKHARVIFILSPRYEYTKWFNDLLLGFVAALIKAADYAGDFLSPYHRTAYYDGKSVMCHGR